MPSSLLIDNPDLPDENLLKIVKGPDFPTGGIIMGLKGHSRCLFDRPRLDQSQSKNHYRKMSNGKSRIWYTRSLIKSIKRA